MDAARQNPILTFDYEQECIGMVKKFEKEVDFRQETADAAYLEYLWLTASFQSARKHGGHAVGS